MKTLLKLSILLALSCISSYGEQFAFPAAGQSFNTGGRIEANESDASAVARLSASPTALVEVEAKSVGCSTTGCTIKCSTGCTVSCTTNCSRMLSTEKSTEEVSKEVTAEVRSIGCSTSCSTSCSTKCTTNCSR